MEEHLHSSRKGKERKGKVLPFLYYGIYIKKNGFFFFGCVCVCVCVCVFDSNLIDD